MRSSTSSCRHRRGVEQWDEGGLFPRADRAVRKPLYQPELFHPTSSRFYILHEALDGVRAR
jgi:hypothetical protein